MREENKLRMEREEDGFGFDEPTRLEVQQESESSDTLLLEEEEDLAEVNIEDKLSKTEKRANASSSNSLPLDAPEIDSDASTSIPACQPAEGQKCSSSEKKGRRSGSKRKKSKKSLERKRAGLDERRKDKRREDAMRREDNRSLRPNTLNEARKAVPFYLVKENKFCASTLSCPNLTG
ncbi:hypothetical protein E1B28_007450 [Marasmius oreades]|uniref:Uncharacterized protein n=1 Tax=Marasmius oreades TaxID=181124 RepID=A0A9P7S3E4_9AGAR|nr:uncharacterized protein E1B28_007450 [Marasmius oreades]KAG7093808.1 hypothetical protein E1B28_007450 [Marasmius oreades]